MSSTKFIVSHQDQQLGPFDESELKVRWAAGGILGIDYIYDEAKQDWVLLAERFRWAAAGQLDDTMPVKIQPPAMTEEILIEDVAPPVLPRPVPRAAVAISSLDETTQVIAQDALHAAEVRMVDGHGEVSLAALNPGRVKLQIAHDGLQTQEFLIDVLAAEPVDVLWSIPSTRVVGQDLEVHFTAVDHLGSACLHFEGEFSAVVTPINGATGAEKRHDVKTIDGKGVIKWSNTRAEAWMVSLEFRGAKALKMPAKQKLEWVAGPATRLVVDGPTEHQAGIPLKVQVKALDAYGNLARNFAGTVVLDVKAS